MANALDVLCMGEALVDFLPERAGEAIKDVARWHRCSGGSPANVAVGLARLGASSGFAGVVGQDAFGDFLVETLAREGVDVSRMRQTPEGKTGLVFISLDQKGDRSFAMFRTRSAELFLCERDLDVRHLERVRAVHCGTNSLLWPEAQRAVVAMIQAASAAGKIVSCDPNLRLHFWPEPRDLKGVLDRLLPWCTVVKLSEDEIEFATGAQTPEAALRELAKRQVALPVVTLGERGALALWNGELLQAAAPRVDVADTTGAGDGFVSALLFGLTRLYAGRSELLRATAQDVSALLAFGCAVGARVVQKLGAVAALPRIEELDAALPALLRRPPR